MSEQELKLHVPAAAAQALDHALKARRASSVRLHALYFDTPARELATARLSLRLRQEGRQWVQTIKMPGANAMSRIELNHPRPGPILDLSIYADTAVGTILAALKGTLSVRYETDVQRRISTLRNSQGTIELAYDVGHLRAQALELPIHEVEFELVTGQAAAIFTAARQWQRRYGLIIDARSKAERGDALAQLATTLAHTDDEATRAKVVARFWAPRSAQAVVLDAHLSPDAAMARVAEECVDQIVRNAALLAEVDTAGVFVVGGPEHVHQLRVGMRRLRSAWRLFAGRIEPPSPALDSGIREYFIALGARRDEDVLTNTIAPILTQAGMPAIPTATNTSSPDAHALCRSAAFQSWLLDLYEWSMHSVAAPTHADDASAAQAPIIIALDAQTPTPTLIPFLCKRLRKWHKHIVETGRHFNTLALPVQHALRKRSKRLRYGLSFAESLLPAKRLKRYRKQLAHVQDLLGEINDLAIAAEYYRTQAQHYPQAWFALGWIAARLKTLTDKTQRACNTLARTKPFWK